MDSQTAELLRLLLYRLERVSVDSHWAHRAGGIRGSLLETLGQFEAGNHVSEKQARQIMERGFHILQKAAEEK
jgi:hypothetical protein